MTRQAASGGPHRHHRASLSVKEALLFEAGIKLGGVFHQYLGTPVSSSTAPDLAQTIQDAVRLQPYVRDVRVRIDPARGGPRGRGRFGYRYLTAEMLEVEVTLGEGRVEVRARLVHRPDLRYPLMTVDAAGEPPRPRRPRSVPRAGRRRGPSGRRTAPSDG